jgi:hypothetical protein
MPELHNIYFTGNTFDFFVYILTQNHAHHKSHFLLFDGFVIVCLNMRYTTPPPPKEQLNGKIDDQPMDRI